MFKCHAVTGSSHIVVVCMLVTAGVIVDTHCLVVERHHLAAYVPERLGVVIGRVHSCSFGVNSTHLTFVVSV